MVIIMNSILYCALFAILAVSAIYLSKISDLKRSVLILICISGILAVRSHYTQIRIKKAETIVPVSANLFPANIALNGNKTVAVGTRKFVELHRNSSFFISFTVPEDGYINTLIRQNKQVKRKIGPSEPTYSFRVHIFDELQRLQNIIDIPYSRKSKYIERNINIDLSKYYGQQIIMTINFHLTGPEDLLKGENTGRIFESILVRYPELHKKAIMKKKIDSFMKPKDIDFFKMEKYK